MADTLDVSRSNLVERSKGRSKPRGRYNKAEDDELLPIIRRLVDQRPTYGYRRIAALLNRERRGVDQPVVNAKRVHRIMGNHAMLEKHTALRQGRVYDGKGMVMCSNLRWCSDGLEFTCWSGEVVRLAFTIDAFDREIIAWTVVANAGISVGRGAPKELESVAVHDFVLFSSETGSEVWQLDGPEGRVEAPHPGARGHTIDDAQCCWRCDAQCRW